MKLKILALLAVAVMLAVASFDVFGINRDRELTDRPGRLALDIKLPVGVRAETIAFEVSGAKTLSGTVKDVGERTFTALVDGLVAASGYEIMFKATRGAGASACTGSAGFDVFPGETTSVVARLRCADAKAQPRAAAGRTANACPLAETAVATISEDGVALALTATGSDPDSGPSALEYHWTSEDGALDDTIGVEARLSCSDASKHRIKLEVYDGACRDAIEQTVTCPSATAALYAAAERGPRANERRQGRPSSPSSSNDPAERQPARDDGHGSVTVGAASPAQGQNHAAAVNGANSSTGSSAKSSRNEPSGKTHSTADSPGAEKSPLDPRVADPCRACESAQHEENYNCRDSTTNCSSLPGVTDSGSPMPGVPKAQLCRQILDCMHSSHCAAPDASGNSAAVDCFCGTGVDPDSCFNRQDIAEANGPCKELVIAGAESPQLADVMARFFDPTFAIGAAVAVVETCDLFFCAKECL